MTAAEALEKVLPLYQVFYKVTRDCVTAPFAAEASFCAQDEHYAVFRTVKLSEAASNEYLFFAAVPHLTLDEAKTFDEAAWAEGLRRVEPGPSHRNTDITLILLADTIDPTAADYLRKLRRSKTYRLMLHGWSNYRVIAKEVSTGTVLSNRMGRAFEKPLRDI